MNAASLGTVISRVFPVNHMLLSDVIFHQQTMRTGRLVTLLSGIEKSTKELANTLRKSAKRWRTLQLSVVLDRDCNFSIQAGGWHLFQMDCIRCKPRTDDTHTTLSVVCVCSHGLHNIYMHLPSLRIFLKLALNCLSKCWWSQTFISGSQLRGNAIAPPQVALVPVTADSM